VNYTKPFAFMFNDPKWLQKMLIGVVVLIVPILNLAYMGYCIALLRNVSKGSDDLPEWDELTEKFLDGLRFFVAQWIYMLPISAALVLLGLGVVIPIVAGNDRSNAASTLWIIFILVALVVAGVCFLYGLLLSILQPAWAIHYSKMGSFKSFFQFKELFRIIRGQPSNYFLAFLMTILIGIAASWALMAANIILGFVPVLGWILTILASGMGSVWSSLACYHLFGQVRANLQAIE
jgi:hypothetical protein